MEWSANLNGKTTSPGALDVCDYVDIVEGQRHQFDTLFALKRWRPSPVLSPETTRAITEKILQTNRVKDTVLSLIEKGQGTSEEINNEARKILQEMGHTFDLKTVRMLGYVLAKLLRQLYQGVMVNQPGIIKMSNAMSEVPVLFLPTHRSYADFLLISYICYTLAIPLPVIAAGMDFKGMKFINKVLQNAGAFYIRRSFGNDLLYWAAVSEYVRHQVLNFQAPIEFFLEGTRSRNGKSLPPKIGLLIMALESYFRGDVPDIQICTMSISYERTLEENLYAYEILGIPKPRESTSGFFSAVDKIRGQNYGRIYTKISDPISVRDCLRKREVPNWTLPSYRFSLNEEEKERIHSFAWELVQRQQKEAITPVSAVLFSLLQWRPLSLEHLENFFVIFNNVLAVHGTACFIQSRVELAIKECLDAHKHALQCDRQTVYSCKMPLPESADLQSRAAACLVVQSYTNQMLGPLINLATFGYIQSKLPNSDDLSVEYSFFAKFFKDEFVLIRSPTSEDLTAFKNLDPVVLEVLSPLLQPFVESFYIILYLLDVGFDNVKQLQTQYRNVATLLLEEGASNYLEILAVDKVSRHLLNLVTNGNLQLVKSNGITKYSAADVSSLMTKLELYLNERFRHCLAEFREKSVQIHSQL